MSRHNDKKFPLKNNDLTNEILIILWNNTSVHIFPLILNLPGESMSWNYNYLRQWLSDARVLARIYEINGLIHSRHFIKENLWIACSSDLSLNKSVEIYALINEKYYFKSLNLFKHKKSNIMWFKLQISNLFLYPRLVCKVLMYV